MTVHNLHSAGDPREEPAGEAAPQLARIASNVLPFRRLNFMAAEENMQLKGPVLEAMRPLEEVGYSFATGELRPRFDPTERTVTLLVGGPQVHHLAQLPTDVASSDGYETRNFFRALVQLFPDGCSLFLFAHEVDAMPLVSHNTVCQHRRITARFVPWRHLDDARSAGRTAAALLLTALNLEAPTATRQQAAAGVRQPEMAGPRPPEPVERNDLEFIARIFASDLEHALNSKDHFSQFVDKLGLVGDVASDAKARWNDNVLTAAKELVKWADHRGTLTLGLVAGELLAYLPGRHHASDLLAVIERRRLVKSGRLDELRELVIEEQP